MTILYWPTTLPQKPMVNLDFSPKSEDAMFEADLGEPISRPRSTGAPFLAEAEFFLISAEQIETFETFYHTTLGQGSQRFALRDPWRDEVRIWRFMGKYRRVFNTHTKARITATMMMLPGVPWFAPYVASGRSVVPEFVADYENDVYGINSVRVAASALPSISGTYLVQQTTVTEQSETVQTLIAGDVSSTQPTGVLSIVGYPHD